MSKVIIVNKCGECPNCRKQHGGLSCSIMAVGNEVGFDDIHKDCPLRDIQNDNKIIESLKKERNRTRMLVHNCTLTKHHPDDEKFWKEVSDWIMKSAEEIKAQETEDRDTGQSLTELVALTIKDIENLETKMIENGYKIKRD